MREDDDLEVLRRQARPDDLASLRRLDAALVRADFRVEGKTVREWIADFATVRTRWFDGSSPVQHLREAGLGAVPAVLDTLRSKRLGVPWKVEQDIRAQCIDVLGTVEPLPTCAVPALLDALHLPSARVQRMALAVLARMRLRPTAPALRALLPLLQDKHDAQLRGRAAQVLASMEGPLPDEVRRAALARLADPVRFVRRLALQVLGRFPEDAEALTALEEQSILDDENHIEALRILAELEPARGIPLLLDTARKVGTQHPDRTSAHNLKVWFTVQARREVGMRALLIIGRLGARAESALPALATLPELSALEPYADGAIDDIARDLLRRRAPPLAPHRFHEPRVAALLRDPPPPLEPSEPPAKVLARWAADLRVFGPELTVRVALAAARRVLGLWEYQDPNNDGPRRALMAMDRWLGEPREEYVRSAVSDGNVTPSQVATSPDAFSAAWCVTYATLCLPRETPANTTEPLLGEDEGGPLGSCVYAACRALSRESVITWAFGSSEESPMPMSRPQAAREIRRAILEEVLPWACGTWDPVTDVPRLRKELGLPVR